ncbi:right-handed parallel beta-helix repeat-containing protein [Noviherbaspirillum humi]|uniref:right-handed parallel beta-helix repeat-containing protein n=1 Tax=Noviherbaspirillum humi TaxID=1688639 RepID=UPI001595A9D4|nr:right-handed parallel beta-helix repeat-containing protein [Noviherbaspirillum humi]
MPLALVACGGGGGGDGPSANDAAGTPATLAAQPNATGAGSNSGSGASPAASTSPVSTPAPSTSLPVLTLPASVADYATVSLECGRVYQGTLSLAGKKGVTVATAGGCGMATLTPGQSITGWRQESGSLYSAPVAFEPAQLILDGEPMELAHWPNRASGWAKASGSASSSISAQLPNGDMAGASVVYRPYEWTIESRKVTAYSNGTMTIGTSPSSSYDGYNPSGQVSFYVEGKLWMLDSANEWAYQNGRVYLWTADGASPEGRAFAAPEKSGIEAGNSQGVTVSGVRIYGAANGINASGATGLKVINSEILNSGDNGIVNLGGSALTVDGTLIAKTRHDAISVKWGGGGDLIQNSRFDRSGSIGMPTNARGAVVLTAALNSRVLNNSITQAGYFGIRTFRGSQVSGNTIDGACLVLSDCGGIYLSAPDKQPLNATVQNNAIRNVGHGMKLAWGIFLDDSANKVTVSGNTVTDSAAGLFLHDGFNNTVSGNSFARNEQFHVQMAQSSGGSLYGNQFSGNSFSMTAETAYDMGSDTGAAVNGFATFSKNSYVDGAPVFAQFGWGNAVNWTQWRSQTGQDGDSTYQRK